MILPPGLSLLLPALSLGISRETLANPDQAFAELLSQGRSSRLRTRLSDPANRAAILSKINIMIPSRSKPTGSDPSENLKRPIESDFTASGLYSQKGALALLDAARNEILALRGKGSPSTASTASRPAAAPSPAPAPTSTASRPTATASRFAGQSDGVIILAARH